jgi:two-component system OmpR family sensor kinase
MTKLARSLMLGLALLWLVGVVGSGFVLQQLIDGKSDDELNETGLILLSFVSRTPDLTVTASVLAEAQQLAANAPHHDRFAYQLRGARGELLLTSNNASETPFDAPLSPGFVSAGGWRIITLPDPANRRFLQLADPLRERREALVKALLWLTAPLALLLGFAAFMVMRASRSLMTHVRRTASAVAGRDPQALGMLPLSGVVTEMRPAIEATNQLLGRVSSALETERSFTYNAAHELRTPIAAALAQVQLMTSMCEGPPQLKVEAKRLVDSLSRLSRLAERLLALARAEGTEPLRRDRVDLARVARFTVDEFLRDPRLGQREIVVDAVPVEIRGDLDTVGLALRNLVENALVHGAGGRQVRIFAGRLEGVPALVVIDDGPGVDPADLPQLTQRFKRGSGAAGDGAGLGLAIVDMLARRLGARLVLHSPPGGEATGFEARLCWPGREG